MRFYLIILLLIATNNIESQTLDFACQHPSFISGQRIEFILKITNNTKKTLRIPKTYFAGPRSPENTVANILYDVYYDNGDTIYKVVGHHTPLHGPDFDSSTIVLRPYESYLFDVGRFIDDIIIFNKPGTYRIKFFTNPACELYLSPAYMESPLYTFGIEEKPKSYGRRRSQKLPRQIN